MVRKIVTRPAHARRRPNTELAAAKDVDVSKSQYVKEVAFLGGIFGKKKPAVVPVVKPHVIAPLAHRSAKGVRSELKAEHDHLQHVMWQHGARVSNLHSEAERLRGERNARAGKLRNARNDARSRGFKVLGDRAFKAHQITVTKQRKLGIR